METIVKRIAAFVTGSEVHKIAFLSQGATSAAWRVDCTQDSVIVRLLLPGTNRPVTYQSEFTILRFLRKRGCPVPEPLMHSGDGAAKMLGEVGVPWTVTRVIAGQALAGRKLNSRLARELGTLLAEVHGSPCSGYGRLLEGIDALEGQQDSQHDGILARWCWADLWPFDGSDLRDHAVAKLAPTYLEMLEQVTPKIFGLSAESDAVLLHADLHGEHIFEINGRLSGIIDFGAAAISLPGWDFAILAHYHGWPAVVEVLRGYTQATGKRQHCLEQAMRLALVIGLYKLSRAVRTSAPVEKQQRITQFIGTTLEMLK